MTATTPNMPEKSVCKEGSNPAVRQGSGTNTAYKNSLEFKAEIIPYDCESCTAPILAVSGDNISLIFNIPKQSFRKLAAAAISHLGPDPDYKSPPEKSNDTKSAREKDGKAGEISKSRLSDIIDGDNTRNIMNTDDDSSEFRNSNDEVDVIPDNRKSCRNGYKNELSSDEFAPNDCNSRKPNENAEMANFQKSSNCESHNFLKNFTESKSSQKEDSNNEELVKDSIEYPELHDTIVEEQNEESSDIEVSPACTPDLTYEECPDLLDVWPDVDTFKEAEEIPLEEFYSSELDGVVTKYLKLGLLNEFIAIKITGDSTIRVSAAKYISEKETVTVLAKNSECEPKAQSEKKQSESCLSEVSEKSISPTNIKNINADSIDDSANYERGHERPADVSEDDIKNTIIEAESVLLHSNLKTESENSIPMKVKNLSEISCNRTAEVLDSGSLKSSEFYFESEKIQSSTSNESKAEDEIFESEKSNKIIRLKLEQKMKELNAKREQLDIAVPGTSPTERLRFTLNDSLTNSLCKLEAKEQTDKSISDVAKNRIDEAKGSALGNIVSESEMVKHSNRLENIECKDTALSEVQDVPCKVENETYERNESSDVGVNCLHKTTDDSQNKPCDQGDFAKNLCQKEIEECKESKNIVDESIDEERLPKNSLMDSSNSFSEETSKEKLNIDLSAEKLNSSESVEEVNELDGIPLKELEKADCTDEIIKSRSSSSVSSEEVKSEWENALCGEYKDIESKFVEAENVPKTCIAGTRVDKSLNGSSDNIKNSSNEALSEGSKMESLEQNSECATEMYPGSTDVEAENIPKTCIADTRVDITSKESSDNAKDFTNEVHSESSKMESLEQNPECATEMCPGSTDVEGELPDVSFTSNVDSSINMTVDTIESMSESDDVKSVASESDDNEKQTSVRKGASKKTEADEIDCAPTRVRSRKAVSRLSKYAIPEDVEVKSAKSSDAPGTTLNIPLKSGRTSPLVERSLRSKSLDPTQQSSKGIQSDKKHSGVLESEEANRKTRAKTPDICRKDLKTVARSSPRKLQKSATVSEPSSTSKATKSNSDAHSKSRANVDSASTMKRSKRGSKD